MDEAYLFANEFQVTPPKVLPDHYLPCPDWAAKSPRTIRFWDEFIV